MQCIRTHFTLDSSISIISAVKGSQSIWWTVQEPGFCANTGNIVQDSCPNCISEASGYGNSIYKKHS